MERSGQNTTLASKHVGTAARCRETVALGCPSSAPRLLFLYHETDLPGESARMTRSKTSGSIVAFLLLTCAVFAQDPPPGVGAAPQTTPIYTPKFHGDP